MRKLLNGKKVKEYEDETFTSFTTKCPDKWLHIDLEEGKIYAIAYKVNYRFKEATLDQLESAMIAIRKVRNRAVLNHTTN